MTKEYLPHQQRVIEEKQQNDDRLDKLIPFLSSVTFAGLDETDKQLLANQARLMSELSSVLGQRIARF